MKLFVADAFTTRKWSGNQAGVALLGTEDFPPEGLMQSIAGELKHSETAFVRQLDGERFHIRYFTPAGEVDLCGHATIASFTVLREEGVIPPGTYRALTLAGDLAIEVSPTAVWMDMAPPQEVKVFTPEEAAPLYAAYGLSPEVCPEGMAPKAVSTGLCDILLPVASLADLDRAVQDEGEVTRLSKLHNVVGVHVFCTAVPAGVTAHCRNFAPLYAIPEEAATGTSNGALTYYLWRSGTVKTGGENVFIQGEKLGKPSEIRSRLTETAEGPAIKIGGSAVISLRVALA
ncbi:MAG: PhzF family phenazine biosynthesis protein [Oscillospiraceae bacterium]